MDGTFEYEDWINIKLEEIIIGRITKRQRELVTVFDANNQIFLVNGFILSRFTSEPLKNSIDDLRSKPSLIYEGIKPLNLKADLISPISYCIAFDLVKRLENFETSRRLAVNQVIEKEEKKKEIKRNAIIQIQQESTLNWIERRITSALMGITRKGINPNQFYWQEKDTKNCTENIKMHSEKNNNYFAGFVDYYNFATEKLKKFVPEKLFLDINKIRIEVQTIINQVLNERLGRDPNSNEIENMLDGERYVISIQIAKKIGKLLDDALYYKFKNK